MNQKDKGSRQNVEDNSLHVVGCINTVKKHEENSLTNFFIKQKSFFDEEEEGPSEDKEVKILKADNQRRVEEMLQDAKLKLQMTKENGVKQEEQLELPYKINRGVALEQLRKMEWLRNQKDHSDNGRSYIKAAVNEKKVYLVPQKKQEEDDYFIGTKQNKNKIKRKYKEDRIVNLNDLVKQNKSKEKPSESNFKTNVLAPQPESSPSVSCWFLKSGTDLFSDVPSRTLTIYGCEGANEDELLQKAIEESLKTHEAEQHRIIDLAKYSRRDTNKTTTNNVAVVPFTLPPPIENETWDDDNKSEVSKESSTLQPVSNHDWFEGDFDEDVTFDNTRLKNSNRAALDRNMHINNRDKGAVCNNEISDRDNFSQRTNSYGRQRSNKSFKEKHYWDSSREDNKDFKETHHQMEHKYESRINNRLANREEHGQRNEEYGIESDIKNEKRMANSIQQFESRNFEDPFRKHEADNRYKKFEKKWQENKYDNQRKEYCESKTQLPNKNKNYVSSTSVKNSDAENWDEDDCTENVHENNKNDSFDKELYFTDEDDDDDNIGDYECSTSNIKMGKLKKEENTIFDKKLPMSVSNKPVPDKTKFMSTDKTIPDSSKANLKNSDQGFALPVEQFFRFERVPSPKNIEETQPVSPHSQDSSAHYETENAFNVPIRNSVSSLVNNSSMSINHLMPGIDMPHISTFPVSETTSQHHLTKQVSPFPRESNILPQHFQAQNQISNSNYNTAALIGTDALSQQLQDMLLYQSGLPNSNPSLPSMYNMQVPNMPSIQSSMNVTNNLLLAANNIHHQSNLSASQNVPINMNSIPSVSTSAQTAKVPLFQFNMANLNNSQISSTINNQQAAAHSSIQHDLGVTQHIQMPSPLELGAFNNSSNQQVPTSNNINMPSVSSSNQSVPPMTGIQSNDEKFKELMQAYIREQQNLLSLNHMMQMSRMNLPGFPNPHLISDLQMNPATTATLNSFASLPAYNDFLLKNSVFLNPTFSPFLNSPLLGVGQTTDMNLFPQQSLPTQNFATVESNLPTSCLNVDMKGISSTPIDTSQFMQDKANVMTNPAVSAAMHLSGSNPMPYQICIGQQMASNQPMSLPSGACTQPVPANPISRVDRLVGKGRGRIFM